MNPQPTTILLSIVIPVYHRQAGLERLFDSLANSSNFNDYKDVIEVIVIDDASPVAITLPPLPSLPSPHLILQRNKTNVGAPASRERGFRLSSGAFIHFHDSDDAFSPQWLVAIISQLRENYQIDILLTARHDTSATTSCYRVQKFFHRNKRNIERIKKRLLYRNCLGPLGGVTFSRSVLEPITFARLSSCQDWQMYLAAIEYATVLESRPDITYHFFIDGDDRISHNALKKIRGFLQLSKVTRKSSLFKGKIRLFYLYTCKQHIMQHQGIAKRFYKKHYIVIIFYFVLITLYWRLF